MEKNEKQKKTISFKFTSNAQTHASNTTMNASPVTLNQNDHALKPSTAGNLHPTSPSLEDQSTKTTPKKGIFKYYNYDNFKERGMTWKSYLITEGILN